MRYLLFEKKKANEFIYLINCWKSAYGYKLLYRIYITFKRFKEGLFYDDPFMIKNLLINKRRLFKNENNENR